MNWNNPWKLTAIGMALVMVTALVTGLVVANWTGSEPKNEAGVAKNEPAAVKSEVAPRSATQTPARTVAKPAPPRHVASASTTPTQAVVDACNQHAAAQIQQRDKTLEVVKDAAVGAVLGAAVGAAGGAIADGGKGAGKGAAIGAVVGAGGGTLYGINDNKKHDENYRAAYASCMRSHGYAG